MIDCITLVKESIREELYPNFSCDKEKYKTALMKSGGVFVTLTIDGHLRGCVGHIISKDPRYKTLYKVAKQAAFYDHRFTPLSKKEFELIDIEVSLLSEPKKVKTMDDIVIGTHGVIFKLGLKSSVFLPKIAAEQGWSKRELLQQLALKAGLGTSQWYGADLSVFTASVIK